MDELELLGIVDKVSKKKAIMDMAKLAGLEISEDGTITTKLTNDCDYKKTSNKSSCEEESIEDGKNKEEIQKLIDEKLTKYLGVMSYDYKNIMDKVKNKKYITEKEESYLNLYKLIILENRLKYENEYSFYSQISDIDIKEKKRLQSIVRRDKLHRIIDEWNFNLEDNLNEIKEEVSEIRKSWESEDLWDHFGKVDINIEEIKDNGDNMIAYLEDIYSYLKSINDAITRIADVIAPMPKKGAKKK